MSTTADRLHLLQDHIRLSLLERKRALAQSSDPGSKNTFELQRSLETLHQGIEQLERDQRHAEDAGDLSTAALRDREDILIRLRSSYDDLHLQFTSTTAPSPPRIASPTHGRLSSDPLDESAAREALMGSTRTPSSLRQSGAPAAGKSVRFREGLVEETEEMENQQVVQMHRRVMEQQDEHLDRLSGSIRNQRELSIQIGDELEEQVRMLDEVDELVVGHQGRLDRARRKVGDVARKAKDHGSLVTIAVLIIVLVLLIALLK